MEEVKKPSVDAERSKKVLSANPPEIGAHVESEGDTDRVLHKEAVDAIKKNAMRNEQRITRTLSKNINAPNFNPYIDRARTPSPPLPPGDRPLKRSEQNLGPRKCYNDGNGNIKLLPVAEVDRLMRERMEREKAAQEAAQAALASQPPPPPPPSPPPSAVFNPLLHKKLQRMTEQNIPMKDPYANDDIVQVGDQPEQRAPWKPMKIRFDSNYCLCKQYCSIFPPLFAFHLSFFSSLSTCQCLEKSTSVRPRREIPTTMAPPPSLDGVLVRESRFNSRTAEINNRSAVSMFPLLSILNFPPPFHSTRP